LIYFIFIHLSFKKELKFCALYNYLPSSEKNSTIQELEKLNIPYKIDEKRKGEILIPEDRLFFTRNYLFSHGIPTKRQLGYEILDKNQFEISPFKEKINYQRSIEGELATTISYFEGINNARINISFPKESFLSKNQNSPSVSVFLILDSKKSVTKKNATAIVDFLLGSIQGLEKKNITIVDQWKRSLFHINSECKKNINFNSDINNYKNSIEKDLKKKIETLLSSVYGKENIKTEITAQINLNKKNIYKKILSDPTLNQKVFKNHDYKKNFNNLNLLLKNLIQLETESPLKEKNQKQKKNEEKLFYSKNREYIKFLKNFDQYLKNYNHKNPTTLEYEKKLEVKNIGDISKISISVIINYKKNKNGKLVPINELEMNKIKKIIRGIIGYSKERKDTITIENLPFFQQIKSPNQKKLEIKQKSCLIYNFSIKNNSLYYVILSCAFLSFIFLQILFFYSIKAILNFKKKSIKTNSLKNQEYLQKKEEKKVLENNCENSDEKITPISCNNPKIIANIIQEWIK